MNKAPTINTDNKQGQTNNIQYNDTPFPPEVQAEFEGQEITESFTNEDVERAFWQNENKRVTPLRVYSAKEVLEASFPQKEFLAFPIIAHKSLAMLFAARGIGKTFVAIFLSYAIACGCNFLKWIISKPRKVLYVDGEMPINAMKKRIAQAVAYFPKEAPDGYFNIINPDLQDDDVYMPNVATKEGQERIEQHLEGIELVVIDNLATLAKNGKANDEESFAPTQEWILKLRKRGIAVLLVHHASKNGSQRGTSAKEDVLDTVIQLVRPQNYETEQGAKFEVHYTKARGFFGDDAEPFEAQLSTKDNNTVWEVKKLEDVATEKVRVLALEGLTQRDIAQELEISPAKVNRICKKNNIETKGGKK